MRERWKIARKHELCYICLLKGQARKNCTSQNRCNQCNRKHHSLLDFSPRFEEKQKSRILNVSNGTTVPQNTSNCNKASLLMNKNSHDLCTTVLLKVIPLRLIGRKTNKFIHALLNEGSIETFINERIVKELGISGSFTKIAFRTVGQTEPIERSTQKVNVKVECDTASYILNDILVVK